MQLIFPVILILASLTAGILLRYILQKAAVSRSREDTIRKGLQKSCFLFMNPLVLIGATWILPLEDRQILLLPVIGVAAISLGGVYSILYTRLRRMPLPRRGSHFCVSYYTNIGSVGGLVVFTMLGEAGFVLMPLYKLLEPVMYFGLGFPIAALFGKTGKEQNRSPGGIFKDPVILLSMSSIALGFVLNLQGFTRPVLYGSINNILIPLMSSILLVSIGMGMDFRNMKGHLVSALSVGGIKFLLVPLTITIGSYLLGMGEIMGGVPLMTIFILSSMPAGFVSIMPASLYGLDLDYANTAWILTMVLMVPVVPWIAFCLKNLIPFLL